MKLQTTIVFKNTEKAYKSKSPIIIHQGGTRSSKTYNILIWLIYHAHTDWNNKIIDIARETMTALRVSAMFDFFQILENHGLYNNANHNISKNEYKVGSNLFRFFGTDDDKKVRGPGRDILYLNEMNELKHKVYKQLNQRTRELTIGDYNPSDEIHWIYDHILTDPECAFFKTTFRDNPFLPERIKKAIYKYKETDPNYWRIYGLGERGVAEATIYRNWKYAKCSFDKFEGEVLFGMDFGFNDPTTLTRIKYHEKGIFAEELIYETELTSDQIIKRLDALRLKGILTYDDQIIADAARPEIIEDIRREGYNIRRAKKEKGSILRGINFIKKHNIYIPKESLNLIREFRGYQWKVNKDERVLDTPVDLNDHLLDALRYGLELKSRTRREIGLA